MDEVKRTPHTHTVRRPEEIFFNPLKLICFDATHTVCRK